ncbi:hypothetical protein [Microbulbifer halophilus]|uniref:hypothetical protein n=1 Tax=Microbulbifer halophilus TaxID=453963 RepID=UPI003609ACD3
MLSLFDTVDGLGTVSGFSPSQWWPASVGLIAYLFWAGIVLKKLYSASLTLPESRKPA